MRSRSVLRLIAFLLLSVSALPAALAQDVQVLLDATQAGTSLTEQAQILSQNASAITQQAQQLAQQQAAIAAAAAAAVTSQQTVTDTHAISVTQECQPGSGNTLCFAQAAPTVASEAIQIIEAAAHNVLRTAQEAGSGSTQGATASGSALAIVQAAQQVTTDAVIEIFQDCTLQTGVCVQRALPEVIARAQQLIAASALNELEMRQEISGSGAVQDVAAELSAQVQVAAEQSVDAHAIFRLTQLCAIDVGLCIQRAMPLMQTALEQVVEAQADNVAVVLQDGAAEQHAAVETAAATGISTAQTSATQSTAELLQRCGVGKGLCLQVDDTGAPVYVFTDGETTTTGTYAGVLDESVLQTEYSRRTVGEVASGICGEAGTCPMVEQLLTWLFGPEPQPQAAASQAAAEGMFGDDDASTRGHRTHAFGASLRFVASLDPMEHIAPAAFGGADQATPRQRAVICAMRKTLLRQKSPGSVWFWMIDRLSEQTGLSVSAVSALLHDDAVCPKEVAVVKPVPQLYIFPISVRGPVSSNALWNACVRGETVTLQDVKANPDRRADGTPKTCATYHTQDSWIHPDLGIRFTWNRGTGRLVLPEGYVPQVQA